MEHYPVLSKEIIKKLKIKDNGIYIDCTLGLGGHTRLIAERAINGRVISFDQDRQIMEYAKKSLKDLKNITFVSDNFSNIKNVLNGLGIRKVDGVLYDLGTSYYQLTDENRGFTYHGETKLDMRMNTDQNLSAIDVLNNYSKDELVNILFKYGDEPRSHRIAEAIIKYRSKKEITLNTELNEIIKSVKGYVKDKHPSKNIFQAIRIEVNNEIVVIQESINDAITMMKKGSIIVVITFHSLEDRTVKNIFWDYKEKKEITAMGNNHFYKTSKAVYPTKKEIEENKASRSAKLRTLTKLTD